MTTFLYTDKYPVQDSTAIKAFYFHAILGHAAVEFVAGGFSAYENVTHELLEKIVKEPSAGRAYHMYLKGSASRPSYHVDDVARDVDFLPVHTAEPTATGKLFTVVIQISANDLLDAAKKSHEFTTEPFTILSINEG